MRAAAAHTHRPTRGRNPRMTSPQLVPPKTSLRSAPEATALLVELGRALRGRAFYETGTRPLLTMLSRAIRLWLADLQRSGALEVEVEDAGLRVPALAHRVPKLHLGGLAERLTERGVRTLRFSETLDADGLAGFIERLASPAETNGDGGFARALYALVPDGIVVNDEAPDRWAGTPAPASPLPQAPEIEEIEPGPEIPAETFEDADRDVSGFDFESNELRGDHDTGRAESPGLDYSLSDAELELETDEAQRSQEPAPAAEPAAETTDTTDAAEATQSTDTTDAAEATQSTDTTDTTDATDATDAAETTQSTDTTDTTDELQLDPRDELVRSPAEPGDDETEDLIATPDTEIVPAASASETSAPETRREDTDTDVLREIPAEDTDAIPALDPDGAGRWDQLCGILGDLERCTEDFRYNDLARRAAQLAGSLSDEGRSEAGIRAIRLFVQHAGDAAKRTPRQREVASEQLERLATGSRLDDLIELSSGEDAAGSLDAAQLLLAAGKPVVAPLLRMALRERNPERRGHLQGILIALGDLLAPELSRALDAEDLGELRAAARLAGECQHPATVDRLEELLMHPDAPLRQEVAKALGRIGDARSTEALARALTCPLEGVPTSAAYCLGSSGSGRAVEALLTALLASLESGEFGFSGEIIRSLGRLGRPEATPDLAAVLLHRGMRKRRQYRELKLAAASALGRIPGDAAAGALAQAAQARDTQIRRAAQTALDRRKSQLSD